MPKVLCVDDSATIRAFVRAILSKDGIQVITASSGAEGLKLMASEKPDLVLLDIDMPEMNGIELLQIVATHSELAGIPIMMLTGSRDASNVKDALRLGARDYVVKPFETQALRQRVRRLIEVQEVAQTTEPGSRFAAPDLRLRKKLLVADDTPAMLTIARDVLSQHYDVATARNGSEVLSIAAREHPNLILMDLSMPVMDGVEARRRLRQTPALADVKVVAMTLDTPEEKAFLGEFDATVHKPLEPNETFQVLSELLGPPGLFGFSLDHGLNLLHFYGSQLWNQANLDDLYQQTERMLAWVLEAGRAGLVIDLCQMASLKGEPAEAAVAAAIAIARRAVACKLDCRVALPIPLQRYAVRFAREAGVPTRPTLVEAARSLGRPSERRAGQPGRSTGS